MSEISVVVPVYNTEDYLKRCIDSIIRQTYKNFDLILIDDGSTDGSGQICDEYAIKDSRIHVIHQKNRGLSAARNAGLDWITLNSSSKWVSFVDSDDWIHHRFLEILYKAVRQDRTFISLCNALWTNDEQLPGRVDDTSVKWKPQDYYLKDATNATVSWGKLYKRSCFKHIRFPEGRIHEDEFVTYRILFKLSAVSVIDAPLYAYYQNDKGIMRGKWSVRRMDCLDAIEKQICFFVRHGYYSVAKERILAMYINGQFQLKSIEQCEDLDRAEQKKYKGQIKRQLKETLLRYRKCGLFPFGENNLHKQVYESVFPSIWISRKIWQKIKPGLVQFPKKYL